MATIALNQLAGIDQTEVLLRSSLRKGDPHMRSALVIVTTILALNLGNGFVLAQAGGEWGWLLRLHMFDAQTGWAVSAEGGGGAGSKGAVGSVVRTTDGGLHWKDVTPPTPAGQKFPRGVGNINALTRDNAWVRERIVPLTWDGREPGNDVIFHTVDGGRTWRMVPVSVDGYAYVMDFINARDGWAVSGRPSQNLQDQTWDVDRSTDGGKAWTKVGSFKLPDYPNNAFFLNATTGWITGSTFDRDHRRGTAYLFATRDGGRTWQLQVLPVPPGLTISGDHFGALFAGGTGDDKAYAPKLLKGLDVMIPVRYDTNNDAGVLFYATHDGGTTWTYTTPVRLPSALCYSSGGPLCPNYLSSSFADVDHGWVMDTNSALYVTKDGGRQWTKVQPRLPIDDPLGAVNFASPQVGWATGQLLNKPVLLKTLDGGRTWTSVPYVIVR